jgi:PAS domain S-box-containing protein
MTFDENARYRQLVQGMEQGAIITAPGGEILFANPAFASMVREDLQAIRHTSLADRTSPKDFAAICALLAAKDTRRGVEVQLRCRAGAPLSVRVSLVSAGGTTATFLLTDLTGRRAAAEAEEMLDAIRSGQVDAFVVGDDEIRVLNTAQGPYRALVERMRQGAAAVTESGEILFVNERFAQMVGLPQAGFVGGTLGNFVDHGGRPTYDAMLKGSEPAFGAMQIRKMAGGIVPVSVAVTHLDDHRLFLFTDMTEQRRHEAADVSNRTFLGLLGHELSAMLDPVGSSLRRLAGSAALEPDLRVELELVERQTQRMRTLIEELKRINPG